MNQLCVNTTRTGETGTRQIAAQRREIADAGTRTGICTGISPDSVGLVRQSFDRLSAGSDAAADEFFNRLFREAPELRALFPPRMQPQRRRLMATLGFAVRTLDDFEVMLPTLRALGTEFREAGASDAHLASCCAAMLHTLEARLGETWTRAHREAWAEFFSALVQAARADADAA